VLVEGERIAYAGPRAGLGQRQAGRTLDASGKNVDPGLIDPHTHWFFDADMRTYLKNGVTTIRYAGVDQKDVDTLRRRIEGGEIPGPRVYSCGPMLDGSPVSWPGWAIELKSPQEAADAARRLLTEERVESLLAVQQITPELMRPIIEVAHERGRPVFGQIWHTDGKQAAEAGIDQLDNTSRIFASAEYPRERLMNYSSVGQRLALYIRAWATVDWTQTQPIIDAMVQRGVSYCPTHVTLQASTAEASQALQSDRDYQTMFSQQERDSHAAFLKHTQGQWTDEDRGFQRRALDSIKEWMRRFHAAGGRMIAGTDAQFGGILLHRELQNLKSVGLSPMQLVCAATGWTAEEMHETDLGRVRSGALADLLVLNRDPLADVAALRDVAHVFKGGREVKI
jgi:hypothetical protein